MRVRQGAEQSMLRTDPTPKFVSEMRTNFRARTGMYLGCKGSAGIPALLDGLAVMVLRYANNRGQIRLEIEIDESDHQIFCLRFRGVLGKSITALKAFAQFDTRNELGFQLLMAIAASEDLSLSVSDGRRGWQLRVSEKPSFQFRLFTRRHAAGLILRMRLHKPTFGKIQFSI
jgi:hypothetical protein